MIINKHGSFYMRSGWGTKIIQAVEENDMIFTPSNEQQAIDNIGLGKIMIKALRYWADAMGLTKEIKVQSGVKLVPEPIYKYIKDNDLYFQRQGSLLLAHRNLALNKDNATAWYWAFNEFNMNTFTKESFVDGLQAYLAVNEMKIKKDAIDKEFLCFKNTYLSDEKFDKSKIMDEDTYPFLAPLKILITKGKAAYVERNYEMIDNSSYCVIYYDENYLPPRRKNSRRDLFDYQPNSGTKLAYDYAVKKGKSIMNLCTNESE